MLEGYTTAHEAYGTHTMYARQCRTRLHTFCMRTAHIWIVFVIPFFQSSSHVKLATSSPFGGNDVHLRPRAVS